MSRLLCSNDGQKVAGEVMISFLDIGSPERLCLVGNRLPHLLGITHRFRRMARRGGREATPVWPKDGVWFLIGLCIRKASDIRNGQPTPQKSYQCSRLGDSIRFYGQNPIIRQKSQNDRIVVSDKLFQRGLMTGSVWGQLDPVYRAILCSKQQQKYYSQNIMETNQNWRQVTEFAQNCLKPAETRGAILLLIFFNQK
jgi:hypothetical protein